MPSIAYSLYDDPNVRAKCYTCPSGDSQDIKVRGKQMKLDCRKFTDMGNEMETKMAAIQTDIFAANLIDIVPIGVDTARLSFGTHLKFKAQSRGGGGLSKYQCAVDYQIPDVIKHDKLGYTEMVYVHYKMCPKTFISTEFQDLIYVNEAFSDSYNTDNLLTDMIVLAGRQAVSQQIQYTDIIGVFGGANERANSYDGILAQAYWAYTGMAYFHSVEFTIDEAVLTDGMFVHAKYAGLTIDILFDSTLPSDPANNQYATQDEVYDAIVNWLNETVLAPSGRKYVDATRFDNQIIVTSKWTEETVNLQMFIDANPTVSNWAACDVFTGVSYTTLQGAMPIDERPILVNWRRYTIDNVLSELPKDIFAATIEFDDTLMVPGQEWALYIDATLWKTYRNALLTRPADATAFDLATMFPGGVYTLDALSEAGGTGLWFITVASTQEMLRNVAHLVDTERRDLDDIFMTVTPSCREFELLYELLHGVMVKDFRLFASNLLCSPFAATLKEPYEKTIPMLPCYNRLVRSNWSDPRNCENNCNISAGFIQTDAYRNCALYELDGVIYVLEEGGTLPVGALPVYEIQFKDTTTGIPITQVENVEYSYLVQTNDGVQVVLTGKDPIFQYSGSATGITFNVIQTVTIPELNCSDTFNASNYFPNDYPFECRGACADVDLNMGGRIDREDGDDYSRLNPTFAVSDTVVITSVGNFTIDATDGAGAVIEIQAWLDTNGYAGTVSFAASTLTITGSTDVVFTSINALAFTRSEYFDITIIDSTSYDEGDGIASVTVTVAVAGGAVEETFTELPVNELITDNSGTGWDVSVTVVTKFGCTLTAVVANNVQIVPGNPWVSFELAAA